VGRTWAKHHGQAHFLLSKESVLYTEGQLGSESRRPPTSEPPLAAFRHLPGRKTILLVLREPTAYLFSRYMQLQFRRSKLELPVQSVSQFLEYQENAYSSSAWDSVFQHAMHREFINQLQSLDCGDIVVQSYERDVLGRPVTEALGNALGLEFHDPETINNRMENEVWNPTFDDSKARSVNTVLERNSQKSFDGLRTLFFERLSCIDRYPEFERQRVF
jgi:hypothetical protein